MSQIEYEPTIVDGNCSQSDNLLPVSSAKKSVDKNERKSGKEIGTRNGWVK